MKAPGGSQDVECEKTAYERFIGSGRRLPLYNPVGQRFTTEEWRTAVWLAAESNIKLNPSHSLTENAAGSSLMAFVEFKMVFGASGTPPWLI